MPEQKKNTLKGVLPSKKQSRSNRSDGGNIKPHEATFNGIGTSRGIAIGECYAYEKEQYEHEITSLDNDNIEAEIERFIEAVHRSEKELKKIERVTTRKLGKGYANIFQAQIMMLQDPMLIDSISLRIRSEMIPAHLVIEEEFGHYHEKFKSSDDVVFQERADDFLI